ncbi:oligosaccharide biosynthesis protein Alg14 [Solitalea lacus]|uniref:oligosaccharide biosynthesis protein Alg14 n=1 Tax=Solitalea lacus TaxID=2911172 RepID=UPI001ED9EA0E|nr:oligosaccharide biosynthesis protein Alg14 [Solitalea lacus]UKJ07068.1 oligosaccharide biosynthesis protein Alg14 [Solitalea lacus]
MKILAIASGGGHWIQLQRLVPAFVDHEVVYISTSLGFAAMVKDHQFYSVPDANRWNKLKLIKMGYIVFNKVFSIKPNVIISTGAAPGLMGIIAGRLIGSKTIWIDSIANAEKLSMSGKIASFFAHKCYTQWSHLTSSKVIFHGNIIG